MLDANKQHSSVQFSSVQIKQPASYQVLVTKASISLHVKPRRVHALTCAQVKGELRRALQVK